MNNFQLEKTYGPAGDGSCYYNMSFDPTTLEDFVNYILSIKSDWGTILLNDTGTQTMHRIIEYRYGHRVGPTNNSIDFSMIVSKGTAKGGRTAMDYILEV